MHEYDDDKESGSGKEHDLREWIVKMRLQH